MPRMEMPPEPASRRLGEDHSNEWVEIRFSSSMGINRTMKFEKLSRGKVMVALARSTCATQGEAVFDANVERILQDAELKLAEANTRLDAAKAMEYTIADHMRRADAAERKSASLEASANEAVQLRQQLRQVSQDLANIRAGQPTYPNLRNPTPIIPPSATPATSIQPGAVTEIIDSIRSGGTSVAQPYPSRFPGGLEID